jgi:hypothetical protein
MLMTAHAAEGRWIFCGFCEISVSYRDVFVEWRSVVDVF